MGTEETPRAEPRSRDWTPAQFALPRGAPLVTSKRRTVQVTELSSSPSRTRSDRGLPPGGGAAPRVPIDPDDRATLAAALAWVTLVAVVDVAISHGAVLIGLLVTGPLLAALRATARTTAVVAAYAVVLGVLLGWPDDMFLTSDHVVRVVVVAIGSGIAVLLARTRERLERARFRYSLMADAGEVLGSALDYEVTLIGLARLCAHRLSDWCFVFVAREDGTIRQVAAAHVDPERQRAAWELLFRYPLDPSRPEGPAKVIRTGQADLQPRVTDDLLGVLAADEENMRLLRRLGIVSAMVVPLAARERTLGAIAFASAESGRVYGEEDLRLAEELGTRAAMAVDNARLYGRLRDAEGELRTSRDQLQAILDGVADAVTAQSPDGRLVYANDAAARQLGLASSEELMRLAPASFMHRYELYDEDGAEFPVDRLPGRLALAGEDPEPTLLRYHVTDTGEDLWALVKATAIRDATGTPILAINVIEDVTEQRRREQELRFLADTGEVLGRSLEWEQTFPEIARMLAGQVADWCAIEVLEDDGSVRLAAFAHSDPAKQRLGEELIRRYPSAGERGRLRGALASGRSELRRELSDVEVAGAGRDPEHLEALLELGLRSALAVPMIARGRVVGAISLVSGDGRSRLDESDLVLAEELAGRCGLALDNARLFRERSRIARTLQESLLPPMLPEMPGLDVSARFRAAGEGLEVGGDFYDLFETGEADWAVAIGDVCGKGSEAAAITALARYTVRAAAMRQDGPSQILALLNEALLRQRTDKRFCTVLYGRLERDGDGHWFEFASAGHPLPLVLRASEPSAEVGEPGTLLGIVPDPFLRDARVLLRPGDAVVLYTDGVTDAAAPQRTWTPQELALTLGSPAGLDADAIAERTMRAALSGVAGEPRDDIAILVLKVPDGA
jgi:PAS domain S-box-containing protein